MALTATATQRVAEDVRMQLAMPRCITFQSSFNRPNLRWVGWEASCKQQLDSGSLFKCC
jgi:superfamily II DNA helicase RecQ